MRATSAVPSNTRGPKTVLVVDDNPAVRRAVCTVFTSDEFTVCGEAANGREAIEFVKQRTPDLILLDLSMPVMNGLEAAPELRKLAPDAVIILFTLFASELHSPPCVDLVVSKTTSVIDLKDRVRELLFK